MEMQNDEQEQSEASEICGSKSAVERLVSRPSDNFQKENHPYDRGYWKRYDGEPRPIKKAEAEGWDDCDKELMVENMAC